MTKPALFLALALVACSTEVPPTRAVPYFDSGIVPPADGGTASADAAAGADAADSGPDAGLAACVGSLLAPGPRQLADLDYREFVTWGADLDSDGDTDFVIGNWSRTDVLRNDGGKLVRQEVTYGQLLDLRPTDLDGNGVPDLIVASTVLDPVPSVIAYLADGHGGFTRRVVGTLPGEIPQTAVVVDVDGDAQRDVVVKTDTIQDGRVPEDQRPPRRARVRAFLQRGDHFDPLLVADDPGDGESVLGAGDLDGDGRVELVVTRFVGTKEIPRVLWNDGGHFTATEAPPVDLEQSPLIVDADGDGRADIVGGTIYVHNDGNRAFTATPLVSSTYGGERSFAADLDGDGDTDLVFRSTSEMIVARREGLGRFDVTRWPMPGDPIAVSLETTLRLALVDVDGNGKPEIVTSDLTGRAVTMNPLAPPAVPRTTPLAGGGRTLTAVDIDRDGDLDLVTIDSSAVRVLANDGRGRFSATGPAATPPPMGKLVAQVVADLDGDGRPDVVVGGERQVLPYFNRSRPELEAGPALPLATTLPGGIALAPLSALAAGDVDGDGDIDLVVGHGSPLGPLPAGGLSVILNMGGGHFAAPVLTPDATIEVNALAIADLDRDGHAELVTGSGFGPTLRDDWKPIALWRVGADGTAQVTARRDYEPEVDSLLIADLDGDGAPELVTGDTLTRSVGIDWNDGKGGVATSTSHRAGWPVDGLAAADLDGDGDLDLVASASYSGDVTLLLNDGHRGFAEGAVLPGQDATTVVAADLDGRCGVDLVVGQSFGPALAYFAGGAP